MSVLNCQMTSGLWERYFFAKALIFKFVLSLKRFFFKLSNIWDLFHYIPPTAKRGDIVKRLLNLCIAHFNSADLLLSNNASDWLNGDFDNKNQ